MDRETGMAGLPPFLAGRLLTLPSARPAHPRRRRRPTAGPAPPADFLRGSTSAPGLARRRKPNGPDLARRQPRGKAGPASPLRNPCRSRERAEPVRRVAGHTGRSQQFLHPLPAVHGPIRPGAGRAIPCFSLGAMSGFAAGWIDISAIGCPRSRRARKRPRREAEPSLCLWRILGRQAASLRST